MSSMLAQMDEFNDDAETLADYTSHVAPKLEEEISESQDPNAKPDVLSNELLYIFETYFVGKMDPTPIDVSWKQTRPSMGSSD